MLTLFRSQASHFARRRQCNSGITVFELLVGLLVAGGVVAIAIPTVRHQQAKTQERKSRSYLKSLVRAQQQHYSLHQAFAQEPDALELKGQLRDRNRSGYEYSIIASKDGRVVTHKARSRSRALKSQVSVVSANDSDAIDSLLCEADDKNNPLLGEGKLVGSELLCPAGYSPLQ